MAGHGGPRLPDTVLEDRAEERFWPKVFKTPGCWLWLGCVNSNGYGAFAAVRRQIPAHRYAYEVKVGPIPEGMTLDHLCRIRRCVNPDHLDVVTRGENTLRGDTITARNIAKVRCLRGHALEGANVYRPPSRPTKRICRACRNWLRARQKELANA